MPFYSIAIEPNDGVSSELSTVVKDQPPLFIIGDILGRGSRALGEQINKVCEGRREVYIYEDPRLDNEDTESDPKRWTLDQQAEQLVKQMQPPPFKNFPILLIGYSYGCTLAAATVKLLKELQYDPHLFLIDAPAPSVSKQFFSEKNLESTILIRDILNYAAILSGLNAYNFSKEQLSDFATQPFLSRIELVGNSLLKNQKHLNTSNRFYFNRFMSMVKQNLRAILEKNLSDFEKVKTINVLITNNTAKTYGESQGGWEAYAENVNLIHDNKLQAESHEKLLSSHTNTLRLAQIIQDVFSNEVKKEEVFKREFSFYVEAFQKRNPDVNARDVLERLLVELPPHSPDSPIGSPKLPQKDSGQEQIENTDHPEDNLSPYQKPVSGAEALHYPQKQFGLFAYNESVANLDTGNAKLQQNQEGVEKKTHDQERTEGQNPPSPYTR